MIVNENKQQYKLCQKNPGLVESFFINFSPETTRRLTLVVKNLWASGTYLSKYSLFLFNLSMNISLAVWVTHLWIFGPQVFSDPCPATDIYFFSFSRDTNTEFLSPCAPKHVMWQRVFRGASEFKVRNLIYIVDGLLSLHIFAKQCWQAPGRAKQLFTAVIPLYRFLSCGWYQRCSLLSLLLPLRRLLSNENWIRRLHEHCSFRERHLGSRSAKAMLRMSASYAAIKVVTRGWRGNFHQKQKIGVKLRTLGIRFQFKVPHLGKRVLVQSYPSVGEFQAIWMKEYVLTFDKTFRLIVLFQWGVQGRS